MHSTYHIGGPLGVLLQFFIAGIVFGYLAIAAQWWAALRRVRADRLSSNPDRAAAVRALWYLIGIFVFCALSGYLSRLVRYPDPLLLTTHTILFVCTWAFVVARQASVIAVALGDV